MMLRKMLWRIGGFERDIDKAWAKHWPAARRRIREGVLSELKPGDVLPGGELMVVPVEPTEKWQPIETAPEFVAVLVQHQDDLYPVTAYQIPDEALGVNVWLRETEGPEDSFYGGDRHGKLYRTPTHWQPQPESPKVQHER